jgi:dissimilatory sulfite reductase (desulfoviridin) alpha/beta subunit
MKWTAEAEEAVKKVPFFVRRRVRERVEQEARKAGRAAVGAADVAAAKARYLSGMQAEIKGHQIDTCFGASGCPNPAVVSKGLIERLETLVAGEHLLTFLKAHVAGAIKFHHEFRITLADCPNACSQPQIKDVGIIGACAPRTTETECTQCMACVESCPERAVAVAPPAGGPCIDAARCLLCGRCVTACPSGTLAAGRRGYRVQLAGRLGRHPRLARELPGLFDEEQVLAIVKECLRLYKERSRNGERFAHLFSDEDFERFARGFGHGGNAAIDTQGNKPNS